MRSTDIISKVRLSSMYHILYICMLGRKCGYVPGTVCCVAVLAATQISDYRQAQSYGYLPASAAL